jgi:hypothetical protein
MKDEQSISATLVPTLGTYELNLALERTLELLCLFGCLEPDLVRCGRTRLVLSNKRDHLVCHSGVKANIKVEVLCMPSPSCQ